MFSATFLVLAATLFMSGGCTVRFDLGCSKQFVGPNSYRTTLSENTNDLVWGESVQPMSFEDDVEFEKFTKFVNKVIKKTFKTTLYDDMGVVLEMKNDYEKSDQSLENFFTNYNPEFSPRNDNLGLILKTLEAIHGDETYSAAAQSAFIAAKAIYQKDERHKAETYEKDDSTLPDDFQAEDIVGIIKVQVGDDLGYVVLDMKNAVMPAGIVLEPKKFGESLSLEGQMFYEIVIENKKFIKGNKYMPLSVRSPNGTIFSLVTFEFIYLERPLCSFLRTESQMILKSAKPIRKVMKIGADGKSQAYVAATIYSSKSLAPFDGLFRVGNLETSRYDPGFMREDNFKTMSDLVSKKRSKVCPVPVVGEIFDDAVSKMNLKDGEKDKFEDKLRAMEEFIRFLRQSWRPVSGIWEKVQAMGQKTVGKCIGGC